MLKISETSPRMRLGVWFFILLLLALTGCGAGDKGGTASTSPTSTPASSLPASIDLLVSNPQLASDMTGTPTVTLTAVVKDSSNRALKEQEVSFTANSGLLTVTNATTDDNGRATATLGTGGDPACRPINLTAAVGTVSAANTVAVAGTTLSINGLSSLSIGDSTVLTLFLKDSVGVGIAGKTVTVTSAKGNTLSAGPYVTNGGGQVTVNVTAAVGGADTITATAIGETATYTLNVNASILLMTPPTAGQLVNINTWQPVTVTYTSSGVPVVGAAVNFATTRGILDAAARVTDATGKATVNVRSTNSGPGLISASVAGGPSAQVTMEFVATTPSTVALQASPAVIGTNNGGTTVEKSLITATVRDANNNLVKNQTVNFTILTDASGGSLSPASAVTDSSGSASTYFIAGAAYSGTNGVTVRASVVNTALTGNISLTVAQKALFISLATGPTIAKVDPNKYQKDYVALVTDSAGNPVAGATVTPVVTPAYYRKGYYIWPGFSPWQQVITLESASSTLPGIPACANEDGMTHDARYDFNGVLDPGEDQNGNSRLDPGNVASVTPATTDSSGHATISITYARNYAYWVNVKLQASANNLSGSTVSDVVTFNLPGEASDYNNGTVNPPGNPSPFGTSTTCYVDLTVTPVTSSQMAITWQQSLSAASYNVYRATPPAAAAFLRNAATNTIIDTGLASNTQFCYQIKTVDAGGVETVPVFTGTVCARTLATAVPLVTPTGLAATGRTDGVLGAVVDLAWNAVPGAALYRIYRDGVLHLAVPASPTTDAKNVFAQTGYCYAISAMSVDGNESARSNLVCAATP